VVAASTTSSTTSVFCRRAAVPRKGARPRWARAFRISDWKITMTPNMRNGRNVRSSQLTVSRLKRVEIQ
jgi:hypothetical protein